MAPKKRAAPKVYLDYSQEELDWEYDQTTLVPNSQEYQARAKAESSRVRDSLPCRLDVAYGESEAERLDIFAASVPDSPVLVYIHGGAWTRGDKDQASFPAETFVPAGAAYVAINFGLVPAVSLDELVAQAHWAVAWVYRNAALFGGDPHRLFVAGHSSGGHIAGMLATTDWSSWNLPPEIIRGAIATSGIYDLEPVRLSARNAYLHLDTESALRNSPIARIGTRGCPLVIGYGGKEHKEFRRQSMAFAEAWRRAGHPCRELNFPDMNHFDIPQAYNASEGAIVREALGMMGLSPISAPDP